MQRRKGWGINRNYWAFLWHAAWLALAATFTDVNTVMPGLIVQAGGSEIHVGILTGIMIGVPMITQHFSPPDG